MMAALVTSDIFLTTVASGKTIGVAAPSTYSANGFLDITGGLFASQLDTNSRPTLLPGVFADLSFSVAGANNQNPLVSTDYNYISSADVQGASVTTVPEPETVFLMGTGLLFMGMVGRRKGLQSNTFNSNILTA